MSVTFAVNLSEVVDGKVDDGVGFDVVREAVNDGGETLQMKSSKERTILWDSSTDLWNCLLPIRVYP